MTQESLSLFLTRKGFKKNTRDNSFERKVMDVDKRYIIKGNEIFLESKSVLSKDYNLIAFADIRNVFISNGDKLGGFNRFVPITRG